jgi:hypothetical protein
MLFSQVLRYAHSPYQGNEKEKSKYKNKPT